MNIFFILENIKKRRKALGYTQKDVALKLFMDERTYSKIERGSKKTIDLSLIYNLAEILQMDVFDILKTEESEIDLVQKEAPKTLANIEDLLNTVASQQQQMASELEKIKSSLSNNSKEDKLISIEP